jgi:tripartite-type tricarboxylate transporter receptor subunit TctC
MVTAANAGGPDDTFKRSAAESLSNPISPTTAIALNGAAGKPRETGPFTASGGTPER